MQWSCSGDAAAVQGRGSRLLGQEGHLLVVPRVLSRHARGWEGWGVWGQHRVRRGACVAGRLGAALLAAGSSRRSAHLGREADGELHLVEQVAVDDEA